MNTLLDTKVKTVLKLPNVRRSLCARSPLFVVYFLERIKSSESGERGEGRRGAEEGLADTMAPVVNTQIACGSPDTIGGLGDVEHRSVSSWPPL